MYHRPRLRRNRCRNGAWEKSDRDKRVFPSNGEGKNVEQVLDLSTIGIIVCSAKINSSLQPAADHTP